MEVYPRRSFYIIVAKTVSSIIKIGEQKPVATTNLPPSEIIHIENDESSPYSRSSTSFEKIRDVQYKPTSDHLQQIRTHETVQQKY